MWSRGVNKLRQEVIRVCINDIYCLFLPRKLIKNCWKRQGIVFEGGVAVPSCVRSCQLLPTSRLSRYTREDELNDEGTRVMASSYSPDRLEASLHW
uniref:Uncharacterized protein n=1 Tax=Ditylenchus dipsaci TaxID=166011 RepID=A0A915DTH5_9BILA